MEKFYETSDLTKIENIQDLEIENTKFECS